MKTLSLFALSAMLASDLPLPPCAVSDGTCIAQPQPTPATEYLHPIAKIELSATAVLTDSTTFVGKAPNDR